MQGRKMVVLRGGVAGGGVESVADGLVCWLVARVEQPGNKVCVLWTWVTGCRRGLSGDTGILELKIRNSGLSACVLVFLPRCWGPLTKLSD